LECFHRNCGEIFQNIFGKTGNFLEICLLSHHFTVPQGSALGPLKFICYTEDVSNVFRHHGVKFHLFANDKQAYVIGHVCDVNAIRQQLSDCAADIAAWCSSRRLQLNASKTELIWFGSHTNLFKLSDHDLTITDVRHNPTS